MCTETPIMDSPSRPRMRAIVLSTSSSRGSAGFEDFYRDSFESVLSASIAFCGDRELALEATQEAFSRCLARWGRLSGRRWREGWVMTTAFNYCRRQRRRERSHKAVAGAQKRSSSYDLAAVDSDLVTAIRRLPPRQREAVLLFYIADYTVATVSEVMDLSEGAVKAHLFKARESLRRELTTPTDELDHYTGG